MTTPDARLTKHNIIANLSMMRDPTARHFRHALLGAAASDMTWREGRDAAAAEFYRHADWLIAGDPKSEGPAIPELTQKSTPESAPAAEPEKPRHHNPRRDFYIPFLLGALVATILYGSIAAGGGL